jgi:hypothetical protein
VMETLLFNAVIIWMLIGPFVAIGICLYLH